MDTIIFDFDGTLANTLPLIYDSFQKLFQKYDNRLITPEEIRSMFGPTEAGKVSCTSDIFVRMIMHQSFV